MIKTLVRHGNSLALVIDKPILDLLKIDANTPLEISTDGKGLTVTPASPGVDRDQLRKLMTETGAENAELFRRLAR
jgi:antitoxin component of MazEF toxin-antitoxin module